MLNKSNKSLNLHGLLRIVPLFFPFFSPLFDVDTNFIYFSHWINMKTIFVYIGASDSTSSHKNVHINFFFHQINHKILLLIWYEKKRNKKTNDGAFIKSRKKISKYFSLELFAEIKFFLFTLVLSWSYHDNKVLEFQDSKLIQLTASWFPFHEKHASKVIISQYAGIPGGVVSMFLWAISCINSKVNEKSHANSTKQSTMNQKCQ